MKRRKKNDLLNTVLIVIILGILAWIGYSILGDIQFSRGISRENKELSRSRNDLEELRQINSDLCAWITLYDTKIDFPIVQTDNNMKYLNTSAYGEPAAYGAIFLDYRNSNDFSDMLSLIYGHHMQDGNMFGNIDKFRKADFFSKSRGGEIHTTARNFHAECVAYMEVPRNTPIVYDPVSWNESTVAEYIDWVERTAININSLELKKIRNSYLSDNSRLVALSTCTTYDEHIRSVLLLHIE